MAQEFKILERKPIMSDEQTPSTTKSVDFAPGIRAKRSGDKMGFFVDMTKTLGTKTKAGLDNVAKTDGQLGYIGVVIDGVRFRVKIHIYRERGTSGTVVF